MSKVKTSCYFQDRGVKLYHNDCLDILARIPDNSIHAVVTDPPYGLSFMGKNWDKGVPGKLYWENVLRVVKPGSHMLCFGGTRTFHRLACAIEDAGWEIRDTIGFLYGSGFPKSMDISKAIDKKAGAKREVVGTKAAGWHTANMVNDDGWKGEHEGERKVSSPKPSTDEAKKWNGYGSALKPAYEPILLCRKPLIGALVDNVLEHGTGGLNIDGCRISTNDKLGGGMVSKGRPKVSEGWDRPWMHDSKVTEKKKLETIDKVALAEQLGRFPANIIHDGSDGVLEVFPDTGASKQRIGKRAGKPALRLGEYSGQDNVLQGHDDSVQPPDSSTVPRPARRIEDRVITTLQ